MPQLRAALVNTTSSIGHHGCTLVCRQIDRLAAASGIRIAAWLPLTTQVRASDWAEWDVVLVNGEGVLHHDRPQARAIAQLGQVLSAIGKPAYLINTVYEDNSAEVAGGVSKYRNVFVRESLSQVAVQAAGMRAEMVPDLTLTWQPELRPVAGNRRIVVTDSTLRPRSAELYRLAQEVGGVFTTLTARPPLLPDFPDRNARRRARYYVKRAAAYLRPAGPRRAIALNSCPDFEGFTQFLARNAGLLVTGRFHGVCIALALGIPVLAVASNSHKIEGLCADAGIPQRLLGNAADVKDRLEQAGDAFAYAPGELESIRSFRQSALARAQAMFAWIAEDASRQSSAAA